MNRILNYLGSNKRKIAPQRVQGEPTICAFCAQSLEGSCLNASSRLTNQNGTAPLALICSRCIQQLASLARLSDWYQKYFRDEDDIWISLETTIRKRLAGEPGTQSMKDLVTSLVMRQTKRACAIMDGQKKNGLTHCMKTGISLAQPRIAIVCNDEESFIDMLLAAADVVGLAVLPVEGNETEDGKAYERLRRTKCNCDSIMTQNGLLVISGSFPEIHSDVGAIYITEFEIDVPTGMETIFCL